MKKLIALTLLLAACATDGTPEAPAAPHYAWTMYTHEGCDGAPQVDDVHSLCVDPNAGDVLQPGEVAAQDARSLWIASCLATQGHAGTVEETSLCVSPWGPAPYSCAATLQYEFRTCD